MLLAWCFSTKASVATVPSTHLSFPVVYGCTLSGLMTLSSVLEMWFSNKLLSVKSRFYYNVIEIGCSLPRQYLSINFSQKNHIVFWLIIHQNLFGRIHLTSQHWLWQLIAQCWTSNKPLTEKIMTQFNYAYMPHLASIKSYRKRYKFNFVIGSNLENLQCQPFLGKALGIYDKLGD